MKEEKIYKAVCRECKTKFELKKIKSDKIKDKDGNCLVIECPFCKNKVYVGLK